LFSVAVAVALAFVVVIVIVFFSPWFLFLFYFFIAFDCFKLRFVCQKHRCGDIVHSVATAVTVVVVAPRTPNMNCCCCFGYENVLYIGGNTRNQNYIQLYAYFRSFTCCF